MKLEPLTMEQCEQVRIWRNNEMEVWRTPFMLTREMQRDFYERCCDRNSPHRYWAIIGTKEDYPAGSTIRVKDIKSEIPNFFIGMGGITYIQWENRIGEITLIIDPVQRKDGLGKKAVHLLLDQAFNHLNLQTVFGECYYCNELYNFWGNLLPKYGGERTDLPSRKYWQGKYYGSMYFSFDRNVFNRLKREREGEKNG